MQKTYYLNRGENMVKSVDIRKIDESDTLCKARKSYGNKNQIMVCIEELNELACVLAKYPRYEDETKARCELHDKALDELADVYIILEHAKQILSIPDEEIMHRAKRKLERLKSWLNKSDSMQETIDNREIPESEASVSTKKMVTLGKAPCKSCSRRIYEYSEERCRMCMSAAAVEGIYPFYKKSKGV